MHPGGEHVPDEAGLKRWNPGERRHQRKFLRTTGRYQIHDERRQGDVEFWGEWEPPSRVKLAYPAADAEYPHWLYEPFLAHAGDPARLQNTDPFVYGPSFLYTGCLQWTRRGPTQLRFLDVGSVVLFGSRRRGVEFRIDTVFVVRNFVDHSVGDWRDRLSGLVDPAYELATLEPWYAGAEADPRSYRLYFGATPDQPVAGMFSFFPCLPAESGRDGFERPQIKLPDRITDNLAQGKRISRGLSLAETAAAWREVQRQVEGQELALGTHASFPPFVNRSSTGPDSSCRL